MHCLRAAAAEREKPRKLHAIKLNPISDHIPTENEIKRLGFVLCSGANGVDLERGRRITKADCRYDLVCVTRMLPMSRPPKEQVASSLAATHFVGLLKPHSKGVSPLAA